MLFRSEIGVGETGLGQDALPEVGPSEVGAFHASALEIGSLERGLSQVHPAEVCAGMAGAIPLFKPRLMGVEGFQALLGHLVSTAETLREHLEAHASTTVLNHENFGPVTLFRVYLAREIASLAQAGVRLSVIGRRDRLPDGFATEIARAEATTSRGPGLHLRIAIDYSGREAILRAAALAQSGDRATFARFLTGEPGARDVDLLIRTGGEQRLSDFLLWESAYAELYFTPRMWPEFDEADLAEALADFRRRERRFGGLPSTAA